MLGVKRGFQNSTCAHVTTEDVHPWELFSSISIQARGVSPFQHTYQHRSGVPETNPPVSEEVRSPRFRQHDVGTATNSYEQPPKRCNSLHELYFGFILRDGGTYSSFGDMCGGQVCCCWCDRVHGLLGWLLPERHEPSIMHSMRGG